MDDMDLKNNSFLYSKYGGGFKGFITGTQSLVNAFFILGFGSLIVLMLVSKLAFNKIVNANNMYLEIAYWPILHTLATIRDLFVWFAIIKCRNNTLHKPFTIFAILYVFIEVIHRIYVFTYAYHSFYRFFSEILKNIS